MHELDEGWRDERMTWQATVHEHDILALCPPACLPPGALLVPGAKLL